MSTGQDSWPYDISFVIPFRNEEEFLAPTLDSLLKQDLDGLKAEVLLLDGASTDQSRAIAEGYVQRSTVNLVFIVLDNPQVRTPYAFNQGIKASRALIIGFGGAHTEYPPDYFRKAVDLLRSGAGDVVGGGHTEILASNQGFVAEAISCLYLSPMGAGVASYHRLKNPGYVDTVYGGVYRREVFDQVGGFNERLTRNQDNELNARVTRQGLRVFYHPALSTKYIQKADLASFFRRAFNFGSYHPVTWKTTPSSFRLRHLIPAIWLTYVLGLAVIELFFHPADWLLWLYLPLAAYAGLLFISAVQLTRKKSVWVSLATIPLFAAYHICYGAGIFVGLPALLTQKHLP